MKKRCRVEVIQKCLEKEILSRLMFDMPVPRSEKQRAALRVVTNHVATLIEGNDRFLGRKSVAKGEQS